MVFRPVQLLLWLCVACLASCSPEPINLQCADPLGMDKQTIPLNTYSCIQVDAHGCFLFRYYNGYPIFNVSYNPDLTTYPLIYDIGNVDCLGMVDSKPDVEYQISVEVKLHHGYVIQLTDGSFGRLFVDSWVVSNDTVRTVNIKRQYAF